MFLLAMLINEKEREHSNSLHNIFVFVNEVFINAGTKFPSPSKTKISPTHSKSKHPPEIYLRPPPQNISAPRLGHMKNEIADHQMTSSNHTTPFDQL